MFQPDKEGFLSRFPLNIKNYQTYGVLLSVDGLIRAHLNSDQEALDKELKLWVHMFNEYQKEDSEEFKLLVFIFMYLVGHLALSSGCSSEEWCKAYKGKSE